jgi:hypothetical protein
MLEVKIIGISGIKRKEYLQVIIDGLESQSKIKNTGEFYRGIKDFKKCYQTRINTINDEKDFLVTECHKILLGGGINSVSC